ncbi:homeodomain transcription factor ste12 [Dinochytrium kinnereticum]|nr:homeodomain transcription factor ste12 [Dinochytrium kinnereticum]
MDPATESANASTSYYLPFPPEHRPTTLLHPALPFSVPPSHSLQHQQPQHISSTEETLMTTLENLKVFLATAPTNWIPDQDIKRFTMPNGEQISCVLWRNLFHITGTDIVRSLVFRFSVFGRPVKNLKKFEEGVFSDLRSLKPGIDAALEEPRSEFLEYLFRANCIRTQKKQKVFFWFSVPHDRLFMDALERDLKRESLGIEPTTVSLTPMPLDATLELAKQHCLLPGFGFDGPGLPSVPMPYPTPSPYSTPAPVPRFSSVIRDDSPAMIDRRMSYPGSTPRPDDGMAKATLEGVNAPEALMTQRRRAHSFASDSTAPYACVSAGAAVAGNEGPCTYFCTFETCNRKFRRFDQLRRHMRCHSGEKPFVCPYEGCTKKYARNDSLNNHVKIHSMVGLKESPSPSPSDLPEPQQAIASAQPDPSALCGQIPPVASSTTHIPLMTSEPSTVPYDLQRSMDMYRPFALQKASPIFNGWKPTQGSYEPVSNGGWNPEPQTQQAYQLPPLSIPNNQPGGIGPLSGIVGADAPLTLPPLTPVINSFFNQYQPTYSNPGMPVF